MKFSLINLFSFVTIVALAIALACVLLAKDPIVSVHSDLDSFSWNVRQSLLDASPDWRETDPEPPLSIGEAIEILDDVTKNLDMATDSMGIGEWNLFSLYLSPLDGPFKRDVVRKWCYVAQFFGHNTDTEHAGAPYRQSIMILMDGTVYVPEGSDRVKDAIRAYYPGNGG